MEELKLEEIIGYLPYGLKGKETATNERLFELTTIRTASRNKLVWNEVKGIISRIDCNPLLLPMTKEVLEEVFENHNLDCFTSFKPIDYEAIINAFFMDLPHELIVLFQERHVDYQDLIGRGLAINKLK